MRLAGLSAIPAWKASALQRLSPSHWKEQEKAEAKGVQITGSALPAHSPGSCLFLSHLHHLPAVPSNWGVLGKAFEGKMVLQYLQPTLHLQARHSAQRAPAQGRNWEPYCHGGCRQAASHPCRTHKSCCYTCTPPAKMYNHPSTDDASIWTSQFCATHKSRTTWEKLYLKQNSLIVCTIKTQISAWLQHE